MKKCQHLLLEENSVKLAYMCIQETFVEEAKKSFSAPKHTNKVLGIDESKFKISRSSWRVYVWWRVSERAVTPSISPTEKHGGGSVIVWEAFINCKVVDLHQVKGKLYQTGYHSILQHHMIPSGTWFVGQTFIVMQDKDQKDTSKLGT